ncbi:ABC transporter permease [Peribacillus kribbensis]|uniref:ABC transporter permease n=1 Tax=Peribacillus kribbensis TaxID=356658 RepID=UPI000403FD3C|nr:ABC transporter permease subunit [Peribacillus kribbensis]
MLNLRNEWMKLTRRRSAITLLVISGVLPLIAGPVIKILQNKFSFTAFDGESFPLAMLSLAVSFYLPLLLALAVSELFSGEQEQKTLAFLLVRPISRMNIFKSKMISTGIYLLLLLLIICITSLLSGAIWLENFTMQGLMLAVASFLLSWFPLMALGLLFIFLVQWIGSSSRALTFSIILYLALMVVNFLFPGLARWLPTYDSNWYQRWINSGLSVLVMGRTLFLLSWSVLFYTLGYYKFSRKEF